MSGTLALSALIADLDESRLREMLLARPVTAQSAVQDPLWLASQLLRPESITRALRLLDGELLDRLLRFASDGSGADRERFDELIGLGLVGSDHGELVALPEVTETLRSLFNAARRGARSTGSEADNSEAAAPEIRARDADASGSTASESDAPGFATTGVDTSGWYAPALASTRLVGELLRALREHPAALSQRGAVTATSLRTLAAGARCPSEVAADLVSAARAAGLAAERSTRGPRGEIHQLWATVRSLEWDSLEPHRRWLELARACVDGIPAPLLDSLEAAGGDAARASGALLDERFPLLPDSIRDEAVTFTRVAQTLGLTVSGRLTAPAALLLRGETAAAEAEAAADFPAPVQGVYLQPDLSVIVPGPLSAADESLLRRLADIEQVGVASTLRIGSASLRRAIAAGSSVAELREFLDRLSLTGIPQPLDFLLGDLERAQGVRARHEGGDVPHRAAHEFVFDPEERLPEREGKTGTAETGTAESIAARVHAAARSTDGAGDLARRLELAIRERMTVRVTAEAAGREHRFVLLPVALSCGRLRATDEAAGVQRTLPLAAIRSVEAA